MREGLYSGLATPHKIPSYLLGKGLDIYIANRYSGLVHGSKELRSIANQVWELNDNVEGLNSSLAEDLAPGGDEINIRKTQNFIFRQPFVCEIDQVSLVSPYAVGKAKDKYIEEMLNKPIYHDDLHSYVRKVYLSELTQRRISSRAQSTVELETAAVIHQLKDAKDFYHVIMDYMLKLRGVEKYEKETDKEVTLIVSKEIPDYAKEAIEILGFGNNPIVEWEGGRVEVDNLVVPSWPEPTPGNLQWLKSRVDSSISQSSKNDGWVYISRQRASRGRKVSNFNELQPILDEYGVEVVYCEDLSLEAQVKLFRSSEGIIGPHGAGLTGMIWADNSSVLELFNGMVIMPFYVLADLLGHNYTALIGTDVQKQARRKRRDRDMIIDPAEFRFLLQNTL